MSGHIERILDESGLSKRLEECRERANAAEVEISRLKADNLRLREEHMHIGVEYQKLREALARVRDWPLESTRFACSKFAADALTTDALVLRGEEE